METFSSANIAPEIGMEIIQALGINGLDLQNPETYNKYNEIAKYFGKFQDAPAIARMVARKSPYGEKIDKVLEYVRLRKSLDQVRSELNGLPPADTITSETDELRNELTSREAGIINEIKLYE